MTIHDISSSFTEIFAMLSYGVQYCFALLGSIEFFGTNLLSFSISVLILSVVFSLIFPIVRTIGTGYAVRGISSYVKNKKSGDE